MNRDDLLALAAALVFVTTMAHAQDSFGGSQQQPRQQQPPQPMPQQQPMQQSMPQQPQQQMPQPQMGQQGGQAGSGSQLQMGQPNFTRAAQMEAQDFGIAPTAQLHNGAMHGPTPNKIPGGLVITTEALFMTLQQNPQGIAIFDVLGGPEIIPGALAASPAAAPGNFKDPTQQEFGRFLQSITGGNKMVPVMFYCQSAQCWMSYNAALRAVNMGFTQVLWYRGGIEAWKAAGLPTQNPYANDAAQSR